MAKTLFPYMLLVVLAVIITFATAYRKAEVTSKADLQALSCGWPLAFVVSDQSWRDPPYPWMASCMDAGRDDPFTILWLKLGADIAIFYILGIGVLSGYRAISKRPDIGSIAGQT